MDFGVFLDDVVRTYDNGAEFSYHDLISIDTGIPIYFAYPYHSWERGTNENTNGLALQYVPKGIAHDILTESDIQTIEDKLNHRPRKRIEKGEADSIVSWHPDRLARNSVDGGQIVYLLDIGKLVSLKFPSHWFENAPQGKFTLSMAFVQSKYYVDSLSENTKRGLRQKVN